MKGLILKDLLNVKGQIVMYIVIMAIWMAVGYFNESTAFFIGVMQMLIVMIPLVSMAYDERSKWERFALTMPVSRRTVVVSKYLFVLIMIFSIVVVSVIGALIIGGEFEESLLLALFSFPLGIGLNGIILPIMLKFGVEKGRFVFLGAMAVFLMARFLVAKTPTSAALDQNEFSFTVDNVWMVVLLFWVVSLGFAAISLAISCRIYSRKEI